MSVLYFAATRDLAGVAEERLDLPAELDHVELRARLAAAHPRLAALLPTCRFAVDEEIVPPGAMRLRDGSCLALIPPVSGG
ncbi:MAG TPA: MoaD/ThiS family protein [Planctomycetota bacterium]|nr:MoaD/ThiS family protein [Planctomycetota bacterium]